MNCSRSYPTATSRTSPTCSASTRCVAKVGQASDGSHDLPYEDIDAAGATANHPYRRLIEHVRTLYRRE